MKVAELTVEELQTLIRETVEAVLAEHFDESALPLRTDVAERLRAVPDSAQDTPVAEVARRLGLDW